MSIINIIPGISNEASGPSYSVVRLCESIIKSGKDVTLASLDLGEIKNPPSFLKTFTLGLGPKRLGRSPDMEKWFENEASFGHISLFHNHGMWQMNSIYPTRVGKRHNIPTVSSPRGSLSDWAMKNGSVIKNYFWPLIQKPTLRNVSLFHATALSEFEDIRKLGFNQPIAVLPNGVDIPNTFEKTFNGRRTLLFLGRIHPKKGLDLLLPAWKAIQDRFPDWQLKIVGDDAGYHTESGYLKKMKSLSAELSLRRIEFLGTLYGFDKWKAYSDAQLFVFPTYSENFGMCLAESLAAGTPAIVTKGAPWSDIESIGAGRWIDIGLDPLVSSLEDLMACSPNTLLEMGIRGREWMLRDYSWSRIGREMCQVYDWVTGKSNIKPVCVKIN